MTNFVTNLQFVIVMKSSPTLTLHLLVFKHHNIIAAKEFNRVTYRYRLWIKNRNTRDQIQDKSMKPKWVL